MAGAVSNDNFHLFGSGFYAPSPFSAHDPRRTHQMVGELGQYVLQPTDRQRVRRTGSDSSLKKSLKKLFSRQN